MEPHASTPSAAMSRDAIASYNDALVVGELVAAPEHRTLPGGASLASFSLTVRSVGEPTTSVPCVWYDPPKRVDRWKPGAVIAATGPVVRRFYRAGGATASRTEVSIRRAESVSHRSRARALVSGVQAGVADLATALE